MTRSLPLPTKPCELTFARIFLLVNFWASHALFRMRNQNKVIVKRRQREKKIYVNVQIELNWCKSTTEGVVLKMLDKVDWGI